VPSDPIWGTHGHADLPQCSDTQAATGDRFDHY